MLPANTLPSSSYYTRVRYGTPVQIGHRYLIGRYTGPDHDAASSAYSQFLVLLTEIIALLTAIINIAARA
ncbi:hypothetical protein F2P81_003778 [Scophthalmus maximus]|uniref:Uncharacterized protein n=1 Tax=Scophthalmus maximus TaxID=52904 RepID=A0A6A4TLW6_SCOMX|nr:hypothetical protein F2P81_003778 [Scophthalmus maximus]